MEGGLVTCRLINPEEGPPFLVIEFNAEMDPENIMAVINVIETAVSNKLQCMAISLQEVNYVSPGRA